MRSTRWWLTCLALVVGAALTLPVMAQPAPGGGGGGGGGGRGGNPAQWRQQMEDRMKKDLGVSDEEFKALQPKIEKVMTLQRDTRGGFGGRGGRGGPPADAPVSPVAEKARALQAVLDNKDAKPDEIKAALTALRDARVKANDDLKKARQELTELLTQRQEAVLVEMGILE